MGALDGNVLVLNSDYRPLNVCNVRRAVVLLEKQKAQTVELDGIVIRSERRSLRAPSVIRLSYHVKRPRPVVKLTRREILARDDHQCQYCGKHGSDLTIDHVTPRHRGGQHTWENVVTACKACNHRKGGRTVSEAHMQLLRQPFRPPATPSYLFSSYIRSGERTWLKFLGVDETAAAS
ncbi:MAG: HNH endonuclease [Chloroflexi bacterium]|nr:HNH endonuclease [Chloroflexota bacterium]